MAPSSIVGAILEDPRVERTRRHDLDETLAIAVLAVLAGADGWEPGLQRARPGEVCWVLRAHGRGTGRQHARSVGGDRRQDLAADVRSRPRPESVA
ncbi:MAG: transposase family protein [Polyangiaceae bacterium]|nr:transposase family protein [Polyangiaceae bacterium]